MGLNLNNICKKIKWIQMNLKITDISVSTNLNLKCLIFRPTYNTIAPDMCYQISHQNY